MRSHRFRLPAGTRVAYFLNQDGPSLGTELIAADIKAAMDAAKFNGIIDELAVYRAKGGLNFSMDVRKAVVQRRSHGTHVLDLAAGEEPGAAGTGRPIVAVQMPARAVEDSTGVSLLPFKILGLVYALEKAVQLAATYGGRVPVVVNLSFGGQAESHTGRYRLEWWVDFLTKATDNSMTPLRISSSLPAILDKAGATRSSSLSPERLKRWTGACNRTIAPRVCCRSGPGTSTPTSVSSSSRPMEIRSRS